MKKVTVSMDDIREGLNQMERWAHLLRDVIDKYDEERREAVIYAYEQIQPIPLRTPCAPPAGDWKKEPPDDTGSGEGSGSSS